MLTYTEIKNYKSIDYLWCPLGRFTLIVGKNNIGKTSVLEAIYLSNNADINSIGNLLWCQNLTQYLYYMGFYFKEEPTILSNNSKSTTFTRGKVNRVRTDHGDFTQFPLTINDSTVTVSDKMKYELNSSDIFISYRLDLPFLFDVYSEEDVKLINDTLRNIPRFNSYKISRVGYQIFVDDGSTLIPLELCGLGIRRALTMLLAVIKSENRILYIDEIETGLHYKIMQPIFELMFFFAKKYNVQIIMTTHSEDVIYACTQCDRFLTSFILNRVYIKDSIMKIRTYDGYELKDGIEWGFDVR